jgi:hypothetical protein
MRSPAAIMHEIKCFRFIVSSFHTHFRTRPICGMPSAPWRTNCGARAMASAGTFIQVSGEGTAELQLTKPTICDSYWGGCAWAVLFSKRSDPTGPGADNPRAGSGRDRRGSSYTDRCLLGGARADRRYQQASEQKGKAPRRRRHSRHSWQCGFCNLQNLKDAREIESLSLRQPSPNARFAHGFGWQAASRDSHRRLSTVAHSAEVDRHQLRKSSQTLRHPRSRSSGGARRLQALSGLRRFGHESLSPPAIPAATRPSHCPCDCASSFA